MKVLTKSGAGRARMPWLALAVIMLAVSTTGQQLPAQVVDAYFAHSIWPSQGAPIHDGVMLVQDGKIVAVGPRAEVPLPARARKHELGSATLIPGLVIAQSNLIESTRADEYAISPEVRAVDGFDPFDDYQALLAAGITTVQISPGGDRLMPGQGGVVKLAGEDVTQQILVDAESLRVVLTRDALSPPTVYEPPVGAVSVERPIEPTKPQLATSLAQAIVGLRALWSEAQADAGSIEDLRLQALANSLTTEQAVRWTANSNAEIRAALELSQEFQLPWILVDPVELDLLTEAELWKSNLARGVILNPELSPGRITNPSVPRQDERPELPVWERARRLIEAGAADRLALRAASDSDLKTLLFTANVLGRGGLSPEQILKTLTCNPARILGVGERVGSLQPEADADFVVLSGEPFSAGTKVLATYSNGKRVYAAPPSDESSFVLSAAKIYSADGVLVNSSLAVTNGKIGGLGADVSVPRGAQIRDFGDAVIIPGLIDCSANLGMGGTLSDRLSLGTELAPLLARDDDQVALGRRGGVTTALVSSTNLPSPVLAFKLTDQPRPLKDPVALRFEIDGNLTAAESSLQRTLGAGKAYAEAWKKYDAEMAEYKQALAKYEDEKRKYDAAVKAAADKKAAEEKKNAEEAKASGKDVPSSDGEKKQPSETESPKPNDQGKSEAQPEDKSGEKSDAKPSGDAESSQGDKSQDESKSDEKLQEPKKPEEPKKPRENSSLEPYRDLFGQKIVAIVDAGDVKAVELAVKLFRQDFDLRTALVAGEAAAQSAELLAKHKVFVVVGPTLVSMDDEGQLLNFAAELGVHGVPLGFRSQASTGVSELPAAICYAVYEGLGKQDALNALTVGPSKFFGLEEVGSLAVGKAADLVVLSGSPLELSTEVLAVMIDGKWVYQKDERE